MFRVRLKTCEQDFRPVKWPPPGPYWCSGYDFCDNAILVVYAENLEQLFEYWPEAEYIDAEEVEEHEFTDRFPKPGWWEGNDA